MHSITLYQLSSTGNTKTWTIERKGFVLNTTWGIVGGKMQSTRDVIDGVNLGKANEITPEDQAALTMDRRVKKKRDDGYVDNVDDVGKAGAAIELSQLSTSFAPAKPISSVEHDQIREWHTAGNIVIQRKLDGQRHFIVKDENDKVTIWSRKMKDMTANVPHIVAEAEKLPNETILDAELVLWDEDEDKFKYVSSILRSKPDRAVSLQQESGKLQAAVFDILFYDGEAVWEQNYRARYELLQDVVSLYQDATIFCVEDLLEDHTLDELLGWKVGNRWEGYVVWRLDQPTLIRWDGKPKRCNAYKLKKDLIEDCIVREPYKGKTGKNQGRFGGFRLYQIHEGEEIYVGDCGGGFLDDQRDTFMNIEYPKVAEIKCAERLKSMKLRYPVFMRFHADKSQDECLVQNMPRE